MTNVIPGVDLQRRLFTRESVKYVLSNEWQTTREILERLIPDFKSYEYRIMNVKLNKHLKMEVKHGYAKRLENYTMSSRGGIPMPGYKRVKHDQ